MEDETLGFLKKFLGDRVSSDLFDSGCRNLLTHCQTPRILTLQRSVLPLTVSMYFYHIYNLHFLASQGFFFVWSENQHRMNNLIFHERWFSIGKESFIIFCSVMQNFVKML